MRIAFEEPLLSRLPVPDEILPGRPEPIGDPGSHFVNGRPLAPPYPPGTQTAVFAMGCFWGAEQRFWSIPGVWITATGYTGGATPNPTYDEMKTGRTGHVEALLIVYDPGVVAYDSLLRVFWEGHDPTQRFRQGRDVGNWYRSVVFAADAAQRRAAEAWRATYAQLLADAGYGPIVTTIEAPPTFYFAEAYHQQYLAKDPDGDCGLGGTGIACPIGLGVRAGSS